MGNKIDIKAAIKATVVVLSIAGAGVLLIVTPQKIVALLGLVIITVGAWIFTYQTNKKQ